VHAGNALGFVITIPNHNFAIYFAGRTGIFKDMTIIDDLYRPDVAILPIGGLVTMGPREAAHSVKNFLPTPKVIIPMMFGTFDNLPGTFEEFEKQWRQYDIKDKELVHP
jgi:L-ascorbate metabolism protein UlaG (beta-lactamase superfamily)